MAFLRLLSVAFAKTFSKLFGVATISFFGRVPSRDDDKVALVGVLSVAWLVAVVAAFVPAVAEAVFPVLEDDDVTRTVAVSLGIGLPLVNGLVISRIYNRNADGALAVAKHLVYGYGYSVAVGFVVLGIVFVVPVLKASHLARRYDLKHLAVMVEHDEYDDALEEIRETLARHDIDTDVTDPHPAIGKLFTALTWVEGRIFDRHDLARDMKVLNGRLADGGRFEIILHATDISIIGEKRESSCVAAILAEDLDSPAFYFTWDDASQELEDRIRALRDRLEAGEHVDPAEVEALSDELRDLLLSPEEWNAVRRLLYRLELDCVQQQAHASSS
jgi:hypothetical protein